MDFQGDSLSAFRHKLLFLHFAKKCVSLIQVYVQINGRQTAWPSWSIQRGMGRREKRSKKGGNGEGMGEKMREREDMGFTGMIPPVEQRCSSSNTYACFLTMCVFMCASVCTQGCCAEAAELSHGSHCIADTWPVVAWHRRV